MENKADTQRPALPDKFAKELRKVYKKQQQRRIKPNALPDPEAEIPEDDFLSFSEHLKNSTRVLALLGAGLSASSGIPTFRDPGGWWREYDPAELATASCMARDPSTVWQFYSYRRHNALNAKPNRAHYALAELAKRKDFLAISQNIDGLSQRAGHLPPHLIPLHGSLFDLRCTNHPTCPYTSKNNTTTPLVPALALPPDTDISDARIPLHPIPTPSLPHCPLPTCDSLLRPDIVWFGEAVPRPRIDAIDAWLAAAPTLDLLLVVGTGAQVWPAAGYIHRARAMGAKVAVVNLEAADEEEAGTADWYFCGDAAGVVPEVLKGVVGAVGGGERGEKGKEPKEKEPKETEGRKG